METRKKVPDSACGPSRESGPIHPINGTRLCTFRPAGCLAAYTTLRDEGGRPTGHPDATTGAQGELATACGAPPVHFPIGKREFPISIGFRLDTNYQCRLSYLLSEAKIIEQI